MEHLINPNDIIELGRPIGKVDDIKLLAYITEVEHLYIFPTLGYELINDVLKNPNKIEYETLLHGGTYNSSNEIKRFTGLKTTIAYFVSAQNIMSGDFQSTRFGIVVKNGDYSDHISSKERSDYYNNTLEVANAYLKDCVDYCRAVGLIKKKGNPRGSMGGITIRKIGK